MEILSHFPPYWKKRNEDLSEGIFFLTLGRMEMVGRWRRVFSVFLFVITAEPRITLAYTSSILISSHYLNYPNLLFLFRNLFQIHLLFSISNHTSLFQLHIISYFYYYKTPLIGDSIVFPHYSSSLTLLSKFSFCNKISSCHFFT